MTSVLPVESRIPEKIPIISNKINQDINDGVETLKITTDSVLEFLEPLINLYYDVNIERTHALHYINSRILESIYFLCNGKDVKVDYINKTRMLNVFNKFNSEIFKMKLDRKKKGITDIYKKERLNECLFDKKLLFKIFKQIGIKRIPKIDKDRLLTITEDHISNMTDTISMILTQYYLVDKCEKPIFKKMLFDGLLTEHFSYCFPKMKYEDEFIFKNKYKLIVLDEPGVGSYLPLRIINHLSLSKNDLVKLTNYMKKYIVICEKVFSMDPINFINIVENELKITANLYMNYIGKIVKYKEIKMYNRFYDEYNEMKKITKQIFIKIVKWYFQEMLSKIGVESLLVDLSSYYFDDFYERFSCYSSIFLIKVIEGKDKTEKMMKDIIFYDITCYILGYCSKCSTELMYDQNLVLFRNKMKNNFIDIFCKPVIRLDTKKILNKFNEDLENERIEENGFVYRPSNYDNKFVITKEDKKISIDEKNKIKAQELSAEILLYNKRIPITSYHVDSKSLITKNEKEIINDSDQKNDSDTNELSSKEMSDSESEISDSNSDEDSDEELSDEDDEIPIKNIDHFLEFK